MHVRATTTHADPTQIDEGVAYVREHVVPVVDSLPDSLGLTVLVDRDSGLVTVTTAWDSMQARQDSAASLAPLREGLVRALGGGEHVTELLELAVLDRVRPAPPGSWSRTTRVRIDPHRVDSAIDAYSASTRHDVRLLDGYCSAVLLVDRASGHGAVSVTFDSREALEASRAHAAALRESGSAKAGAEVTDVRESEVVLSGIRG